MYFVIWYKFCCILKKKIFKINIFNDTKVVANSILFGFYLFLITEILIFIALFWNYFNTSISAPMHLGLGFYNDLLPHWEWDLFTLHTTLILTVSSFFVTWTELDIKLRRYNIKIIYNLILTIVTALCFIIAQIIEFSYLNFTFYDGAYSQSFYSLVGLHGLHAVIGFLFLLLLLYNKIYK